MKGPRCRLTSTDKAIEATAAAWLAQRDEGLTAKEAQDFSRWCQADVRHKAAVERLERTWTALQELKNFRLETNAHLAERSPPKRNRVRIFPFPALAVLAALAIIFTVFATSFWRQPAAPYTTATDHYERMALIDGSLVELSANSELAVNFTEIERSVRLSRGEANFIVAKDPRRPFSVSAGSITVRAIGTTFNVRLGAQEVEVLVTEGKVRVASHQESPESALSRTRHRDTIPLVQELSAGERIVIPTGFAAIQDLVPEAVRDSTARQDLRLAFHETPLAEVIRQFNRRNEVQIELGDTELGTLPVSGNFGSENAEAFVRLLANDRDIAVERPAPNRIVLRKAK